MSKPISVLVALDCGRGGISQAAREILALGRDLAGQLGGGISCLPFGADVESLRPDLAACGADQVCRVAGAEAAGYHPEMAGAALAAAQSQLSARVVLLPHGPLGQDLAPRLALASGMRWISSCVGIEVAGGDIATTRSEVGGKVQARETLAGPAVVTMRPKSFEVTAAPTAAAEILDIAFTPPAPSGSIEFIARDLAAASAVADLEAAEVIVSGGLGMGAPEAFSQLQALATALGGRLGASKLAVDRGWIRPDHQVGLTGTTVAPKLYFAVGISGALQHMAGCQKAKTIIALNKDPEAPIFRFARYGLVGGWEEILPDLLRQLPDRS